MGMGHKESPSLDGSIVVLLFHFPPFCASPVPVLGLCGVGGILDADP